jgi:hypothetical protein
LVQLRSAADRASFSGEQAVLRREASLRRIARLVAGEATHEPDPLLSLERERARGALAELSRAERAVLEPAHFDGLTQSQIASRARGAAQDGEVAHAQGTSVGCVTCWWRSDRVGVVRARAGADD